MPRAAPSFFSRSAMTSSWRVCVCIAAVVCTMFARNVRSCSARWRVLMPAAVNPARASRKDRSFST
ncbi:hypothetical protein WS83_01770 [Burkholderia sp. MSMB2042]|nr:hypothetical protein WS83_01770 [Burkholderia sp. MSMB2042]